MGRLDDIIKKRQEGAAFANKTKLSSAVVVSQEKRRIRKKRITISFVVIFFIICFIYIPGLFIKEDKRTGEVEFIFNEAALAYGELSIKNNPNDDFDMDGIPNSVEEQINTDPWFYDTDMDGWSDYQEYKNNTNPRSADKSFNEEFIKLLEKDKTYRSAYNYNGVILWASDEKSRAYGGVVQNFNGNYYFNDFKGYAKFPYNQYVYKYENGKHTLLKHDAGGRWKIDGDMFVVTSDEKKESTIQLTLFGGTSYIKCNKFTNFLEKILPNKGFIAMKTVIKEDLDINIEAEKTATDKLDFDIGIERFNKNDTQLENLALVKNYIDNGYAVPVSLYNLEQGELIAFISGYKDTGEFLISNTTNMQEIGVLKVYPISRNTIIEGKIGTKTYYQWEALGCSSFNGDRISFLYDKFFNQK